MTDSGPKRHWQAIAVAVPIIIFSAGGLFYVVETLSRHDERIRENAHTIERLTDFIIERLIPPPQ